MYVYWLSEAEKAVVPAALAVVPIGTWVALYVQTAESGNRYLGTWHKIVGGACVPESTCIEPDYALILEEKLWVELLMEQALA